MSWDKSLIEKKKAMAQKQNKTRNYFIPFQKQAGVQTSPGDQAHITYNGYLGRQKPSLQMSPIPPFPHFMYWAWCHMLWNISLVSLHHLSQLCFSQFLLLTSSLTEHETRGEKIFMINMTWEKPKISVCYQCHSHSESKSALLIAPEINTILDEARIPGLLADDWKWFGKFFCSSPIILGWTYRLVSV